MKKIIFTLTALLIYGTLDAQCPTGNITLASQQEIDDFATDYSGCTEVPGSISISDYGLNINSLAGLSQITSIGGSLIIDDSDGLTSLSGLENLTTIGGNFALDDTNGLTSLTGLESLTSVGGLTIIANSNLTDLTSLDNLTSVDGFLRIIGNDNLTSLSGIENIDHTTITELVIQSNDNLSVCELDNICAYLQNNSGNILNNASGCDNTTEIFAACGLPPIQCPTGDITFSSQQEIDDFATDYPGCTEVSGSISIDGSGPDITSLAGLGQITSVGGNLNISDNSALSSLSGLENLTSIGGNFSLDDTDGLTSLTGLENLTSVGGLTIIANSNLTDLTSLDNLTSVDGFLRIIGNDNLTSLSGIENIDHTTITELVIQSNDNLSVCELDNICAYLQNNSGNILNNAPGCDNTTEIFAACGLPPIQCPTGDITFSSQQEIDDFATDYPGCTEVSGGILMYGSITSLIGLSQITSVGGDLTIISSLTSLAGLENLTSVGGDLDVRSGNLTSLAGLDNLTSIGGDLVMPSSSNLTSFVGLENLTSIGGDLRILLSSSLTSLAGLENVTYISGLTIRLNNNLTDLTSLDNLTSIGGGLSIRDNNALTSLSGLENIDHTTIDFVRLEGNNALSSCGLDNICAYLENGVSTISDNASGCDNLTQVLVSCGLPIELLRFDAQIQHKTVVLTWQTATETNNKGFEIQRSKDGNTWETIAWQAGQGNSQTLHEYNYTDRSPLFGTSYYRLKQIDFGGTYSYSPIVPVNYKGKDISIYPNPVKDVLQIADINNSTILSTAVFDAMGKQILLQNTNSSTLDVSTLRPGVYLVEIILNNNVFSDRFLIAR